MKIFLFWHYDFSVRLRAILFVIIFGLFWIALAVRRFKKAIIPGAVLLIISILWSALFSSLCYEEYSRRNTSYGVIVSAEVMARKGDGDNYEPSFKEPIHAGTEFTVIEKRSGWVLVQLADNRECWLPVIAVEII